jgi:hypothetical protein
MGGPYVRFFATDEDLATLWRVLERAGYEVYDVPQNPWLLKGVRFKEEKGGVYTNKYGEISAPAEIYEYFTEEVQCD